MRTSAAKALNELQERERATQEAVAQMQRQLDDQTRELLRAHSASSTKLSRDAQRQIETSLAALQAAFAAQSRATAKQMRWLLAWPIAGTAITCLALLLASSLASWSIVKGARTEAEQQTLQAQQALEKTRRQVAALEAEFCKTPAGRKYCISTK
ncbi:MAG: hypothetical protein C0423_01850 [Methylibium sp.]|nr:hypothetical protein [Methylibium sp.]